MEQVGRTCTPLPVVSKNRIRLADRSELSLSCWIAVHIRMILFTELVECFVNDGPCSAGWVGDTL